MIITRELSQPESRRLCRMCGILAILVSFTQPAVAETVVPDIAKKLAEGEPVRIVCFGDSVTGIYYHTGGRRAYPEMLQVALRKLHPEGKIDVINAGVSGNTTVNALARIEKDVLDKKPDLVTVMFGLNDMTRVSLDDFKANLATMTSMCRKVGAEVVFATPNGVVNTGGRPIAKLVEYMDAMRAVGEAEKVPVIDVYAAYQAVLQEDPIEFALLLSDSIHPNMAGHKLTAETLAAGIAGKPVSLKDEAPLTPVVPKIVKHVTEKKSLKILAMAPYHEIITAALKELAPEVPLEVTLWDIKGMTLAEIEVDAKQKVRAMRPDAVVVAVPLQDEIGDVPQFANSYGWVLNWSLSFGLQEWDLIAVPPSITQPLKIDAGRAQDALVRKLIAAQDLGTLSRGADDTRPAAVLFREWLAGQLKPSE